MGFTRPQLDFERSEPDLPRAQFEAESAVLQGFFAEVASVYAEDDMEFAKEGSVYAQDDIGFAKEKAVFAEDDIGFAKEPSVYAQDDIHFAQAA